MDLVLIRLSIVIWVDPNGDRTRTRDEKRRDRRGGSGGLPLYVFRTFPSSLCNLMEKVGIFPVITMFSTTNFVLGEEKKKKKQL